MDQFRFATTPFTREIRIEHRFRAEHLDREVGLIKAAIDSRQSAALIAPAGAGKTAVLRALRSMLSEARYKTTYLKLSELSARDMCRQIASALGASRAGHYPTLVKNVEEMLRSGFEDAGLRPVIIIDDAHEMRRETLKLIRLLTNFDMDSRLIVSIILCGQLPLKEIVLRPDMEDIKQRLVQCSELRLLTREETSAYVEHRVKIAGAPRSPFSADALEAVFELTRGNMRAIDKLAAAALADVSRDEKRETVEGGDIAAARARLWM